MHPPVVARYLPSPKTLAIVARVAFWPLAWALVSSAAPTAVVPLFFAVVAFVTAASVFARRRTGGGFAVGLAALVVLMTALMGIGRFLPTYGGIAGIVTAAAYAWMLSGVREPRVAPDALDVAVRALAPFAAWMAVAASVLRVTAEAVHLHAFLPGVSILLAAIALVAAVTAVVIVVRQRAWTKSVYAGAASPLRVAAIAHDVEASTIPPLAPVPESTSAIVDMPASPGPYRAHGGVVIARVPAGPERLLRHYARRLADAAFASIAAAAALAFVTSTAASAVHSDDDTSVPKELGRLPASCALGPPALRFVALAPLRLVDVDSIAARYRSVMHADVRVEVPLPFEERFIDAARDQVIGEEVLAEARRAYPRHSANEMLVVVTDRDMYLREMDWRWAFATRREGIAVVSVARMDPAFLWSDPGRYSARAPVCAATLRARAFKMITRQIMLGSCNAPTVDDAQSVRRRSILGMGDLDAVDEARL